MANIFNLTGSSGKGIRLIKIAVTNPPTKKEYLSGEQFNKQGMVVTASYGISESEIIATAAVSNYTCSPEMLTDGVKQVTITFTELGVTCFTTVDVTVIHKLVSITCTNPTTTTYEYGATLSTTGATVTATYSDKTTANVTTSATFSPTSLTTIGSQVITVSYTERGITQKTTFNVTVERKRVPIPTWKANSLTYDGNAKDCLNTSYWNNYNTTYMTATGDTNKTNAGTYNVTFTPTANYQWNSGNTPTGGQSCQWVIDRQKITNEPVWKGSLTYTGSQFNIASTSYWTNYDTIKMSIGGATTGTTAGTYSATFTPTGNYCWSDGTVAGKQKAWSIGKANGQLTLSPGSVSFSSSSKSASVTANKHGSTGALTQSGSLSGCTVGISNLTITLTGNGTTAINNGTVTISMAADTNYTATTAAITVNASYWSWGTDNSLGDAAWWTGLKNYLAAGGSTSGFVGKKKKVTLNTAVCGWNNGAQVSMTCIGVNIDANNSATFQTTGCSPFTTVFSNSSALWKDSTAKTLCETFATNCSASGAIKAVTKLTSTYCNNSQTNNADDETVCKGFLPSECEIGFTSSNGYAPSYVEWTKGRTGTPYPYYTNNTTRQKTRDNADGSAGSSANSYWERSRDYSGSNIVCRVGSNGNANNYYYYNSYCLAPAIVIG